ncbi:MAG: thioredoxin family protein, partial [Ignavibacteria bacterium]|nr:thioredoxin family protein [Ignavibacteria bacterium]
MSIKVLGTGCIKCNTLAERVKQAIAKNNFDAELEKVEDLMEIMKYGVMVTPALVINGKVVASGSPLPSTDQITQWI